MPTWLSKADSTRGRPSPPPGSRDDAAGVELTDAEAPLKERRAEDHYREVQARLCGRAWARRVEGVGCPHDPGIVWVDWRLLPGGFVKFYGIDPNERRFSPPKVLSEEGSDHSRRSRPEPD